MRRANQILLRTLVNAIVVPAATQRLLAGRASDVYNVTPADLDAAEKQAQNFEKAWKQAGAERVTHQQLDGARQNADELQRAFEHAKRQSGRGMNLIYLQVVHLFVMSRLPGLGKLILIGGGTVILFACSLIASPIVFSSFGTAVAGALAVTALGSSMLAASASILWPTDAKRKAYHALRQEWRRRCSHVEELRTTADAAWNKYQRMCEHWRLHRRFATAQQRRDEIAALIASAKYQLIHTDWRSLRDKDFEQFLSRVFEMLGYHVTLTKTTADQGVDLVATGNGRRIAVQAKGYHGSVSNHAVMEAVAGMTYYQCHCCAVITNSRFTRAAERLAAAHSTACRLIDGTQMVDLIEGRIF